MQHHGAVACYCRATAVLEGLLAVGNLMNNDKSNPLESLIKLPWPLWSLTLSIFKAGEIRSEDDTWTAKHHANVVAGIQLIRLAFANPYCPSLTDRCFGAPERTPYWGTPGREMNGSLLSYIRTRPSFALPSVDIPPKRVRPELPPSLGAGRPKRPCGSVLLPGRLYKVRSGLPCRAMTLVSRVRLFQFNIKSSKKAVSSFCQVLFLLVISNLYYTPTGLALPVIQQRRRDSASCLTYTV